MTNTPKLFLWFDMDGTLFDFPEKLAARLEKKKHIFPQETHEIICNPQKRVIDDVRELFEDKKLQDIVKKHFRQEYQNKKFFDSLEPYPWVIEAIWELEKTYTTCILTKASKSRTWSHSAKAQTIEKYFWEYFADNRLIIAWNKTLLNIACHIDDTASIAKHSDNHNDYETPRKLILMDQPKNQHITWIPRLYLDKQEERWSIIANVLAN